MSNIEIDGEMRQWLDWLAERTGKPPEVCLRDLILERVEQVRKEDRRRALEEMAEEEPPALPMTQE